MNTQESCQLPKITQLLRNLTSNILAELTYSVCVRVCVCGCVDVCTSVCLCVAETTYSNYMCIRAAKTPHHSGKSHECSGMRHMKKNTRLLQQRPVPA